MSKILLTIKKQTWNDNMGFSPLVSLKTLADKLDFHNML
jgi:hypothetical protein